MHLLPDFETLFIKLLTKGTRGRAVSLLLYDAYTQAAPERATCDNRIAMGGSAGANVPTPGRHLARFGLYEFDLINLKLFRKGRNVELQNQPALLLAFLVNRAGHVVTRAELREVIWANGTYVEFDFGLNTTVNRLRRTLRDSAAAPSYIETVPKQGYRLLRLLNLFCPLARLPVN